MTSSSVSKAKLTNSDLEVDLIVVPVCKFWFPAGKYWLAIFSTASLAIWRLWARLAMSQGNLLRDIDNCSDAALQSVRRPWTTVSVTTILLFYPLDSRNTKKPKTKRFSFSKQQSYFSQIISKKAKITIWFFRRKSKNNNIILGFSFQFYVFGFSWCKG